MDRHEAVLLFNALAGAQAIRSFEKSSNFSRILHLAALYVVRKTSRSFVVSLR